METASMSRLLFPHNCKDHLFAFCNTKTKPSLLLSFQFILKIKTKIINSSAEVFPTLAA